VPAPFGPTHRGGWRGLQGLQHRCEKRALCRTLAGSVVVCDPQLARTALVDKAGRLQHEPAFWRVGADPLPDNLRARLNQWVFARLADEDPTRSAGIAIDRVVAGSDDLHHLCLHAVADAMAGPLGFDDDPELDQIVRWFIDAIFLTLVTGSARRANRQVFRRIRAAATDHLARRTDVLPDEVSKYRVSGQPVTGEVYLRAVTAFVGAPAMSLAWLIRALYVTPLVAARRVPDQPESPCDAPAEAVALEVLRLWPPAWQFRRRVLHDHPIGSLKVLRGDEVVIPVYALQRHPAHWADPDRFDPRRWIGAPRRPAPFLPFAAGPGACPGATFEVRWLAAATTLLRDAHPITVVGRTRRPCVTAVLSPPRAHVG